MGQEIGNLKGVIQRELTFQVDRGLRNMALIFLRLISPLISECLITVKYMLKNPVLEQMRILTLTTL